MMANYSGQDHSFKHFLCSSLVRTTGQWSHYQMTRSLMLNLTAYVLLRFIATSQQHVEIDDGVVTPRQ